MTGDYTSIQLRICPLCCAPDSDCPECSAPGCYEHPVEFGTRVGYCGEHRDLLELETADTLRPAALEVA
jgi:hypothetical protein